MNETTANLLVAVVGALGTVLAALAVFLARRGLGYLESKTRFLKDEADLRKAESIRTRVEEAVETAVRATQQTFVDGLKAQAADGKLTGEEAGEAFRRARDAAANILKVEGIPLSREVLEDHPGIRIDDDRSRRDLDVAIFPTASVTLLPLTVTSALGFPVVLPGEVLEGVERVVRDQVDASPFSTISTGGTPFGDVLLPSEGDASVPAVTRGDFDGHLVDEQSSVMSMVYTHGLRGSVEKKRGRRRNRRRPRVG